MTDDRRIASAARPPAARPPAARPPADAPADTGAPPVVRRRWLLFAGLATAIVVADQATKVIVTSALAPGQSVDVVGELVRIVFGQNTGALFGMFKDNAAMFGLVSLLVIGLIVAYHARASSSLYLTLTLGFLLGGAIGNMIDRLRLGYVVDFVDAGIGTIRFYTFNVADSAISLAIVLLFVAAIRPSLIEGGTAPTGARPAGRRAPGDEDPWDDEVDEVDEASPAGAAGPDEHVTSSAAEPTSAAATSAGPDGTGPADGSTPGTSR